MNQRKNDERRSIEAARLLLMQKTIDTQAARISALEALLAEAGSVLVEYSKHDISEIRMLVDAIEEILPATQITNR